MPRISHFTPLIHKESPLTQNKRTEITIFKSSYCSNNSLRLAPSRHRGVAVASQALCTSTTLNKREITIWNFYILTIKYLILRLLSMYLPKKNCTFFSTFLLYFFQSRFLFSSFAIPNSHFLTFILEDFILFISNMGNCAFLIIK